MNFAPVELFKRLEIFYFRWCDGEFMDAAPETLPQKKMRQLQGQKIQLGVRQVDIYAGLNVIILLFELHRYAQLKDDLKDQIAFYPCRPKDTERFDESQLLRIIDYSHSVEMEAFTKTIGSFMCGAYLCSAYLCGANLSRAKLCSANLCGAKLSGADLCGADLSGADLYGADLSGVYLKTANLSRANLCGANLCAANLSDTNLSGANLSGATLRRVDLRCANLSGANLSGATLSRANLSRANLSGAKLCNAYLSRTDLCGANLCGADLFRANLSRTDLENISWDKNIRWDDVQGLETAENVPEALKQQLGLP